ncbi:G2/mitotic-specific cyclin-A isoform X2 [Drosophila subobscura]|uniref:G2/mitotic-specific cyclin-A isoform X1 n=1 Tax=Drosophila subobscura TaxID=7241 RepID=UPI00155AF5CB|nr:G2/mitotic-specific cyclin-A isoform X1 [Drosophila subobscura]XP_034657982.1 G2/mitotic-specific cyclin-A isoform X2 [Drosophila subobscura]
MASFQILHDLNNKENPGKSGPGVLKEKNMGATKQPLAVIGGGGKEKIALGPRTNFAVLNSNNNNGNVQRAQAAPSGKVQFFRDVKNINTDENTDYAGLAVKKSNVVPVVEQFKTFSVYEDNIDTQVVPPGAVKSQTSAADKENQHDAKYNAVPKEFSIQHEYDLQGTPMSVTDVMSPMSVDRSIIEVSSSTDDGPSQGTQCGAVPCVQAKELPPRNDRQRFFEVVQYQMDILKNFHESEKKRRPKREYMRKQKDINYNMRSILVDWLVEVSEEYKLDTETLYLSVSYLDRFLSQMAVVRPKLQLVGTAAMYIASKYEEIYPPDVGEFVFLTDDSYTKSQVLRMEQVILKTLSFDLCTPTAYVFVNTYAVMCDMPEKLKSLTLFLCELALMQGEPYLEYLPSLTSAAALAMSRHILGMEIWTPHLEEITTYKLEDLKTVVLELCQTHNTSKELNTQAIREKYNREKYKKVASIETIQLTEKDFDQLLQGYIAKQKQEEADINSASEVNLFYKF